MPALIVFRAVIDHRTARNTLSSIFIARDMGNINTDQPPFLKSARFTIFPRL
jgi:hypothetical protein